MYLISNENNQIIGSFKNIKDLEQNKNIKIIEVYSENEKVILISDIGRIYSAIIPSIMNRLEFMEVIGNIHENK